MADAPPVRTSGAGTRAQAAQLGRDISASTAQALAGHRGLLRIDTLRIRLPAGSGRTEIEHAVRRAIERRAERS